MTEPLQVGQFAIVDGEPVDRGPNAGVFHGKGPTDDRAELFVLAEGTTPAGEAFAGHVISALGQSFGTLDMSLTGALRRLYVESERSLQDWNRKSIAQHRVSIGLTAFGRRGGQAVLAQAGPSAAYHLHNGEVTPYFAEFEHATAIGSGPVQPQLTRLPFDDGDRLLMISSAALNELDEELLVGILQLPAEQVLPDLYRRVVGLRQVTVILVTGPVGNHAAPELEDEDAEDAYVIDATLKSGASEDDTYQPSLFIDDEADTVVSEARAQLMEVMPRRSIDAIVPSFITEAPAPLLRVAGDSSTSLNRIAAEGQARAARSRAAVATISAEAPTPQAPPRPAWRNAELQPMGSPAQGLINGNVSTYGRRNDFAGHIDQPQNANGGNRPRKAQSFSRGLVSSGPPPARPELLSEDLPLVDTMATVTRTRNSTSRPLADTLANESGAAMAGGAPLIRPRNNMGGRWKGSGSFGGRTSMGTQLPPTWMVIMGALAVLIVIAGIVTIPRMIGDDNHARVTSLIDGAQQRITAASSKADAGEKRQMLTEAQAMLLEARDLGGSSQADQLISQVAATLTIIDNVKTPQAVETVASLQQFGSKPVAVSRMVIGGDAAFLLDVNSSQVVRVPLNGSEPSGVFNENKDAKQAKPVALAQLDQSDQGGPVLLIADASNRLWAYSAGGGVRALAFAPPANLTISDIAVFGPDLYVLDASQATIYRFSQSADGFPNAPTKAMTSSELSGARRLMVDGEFITSDANGTVHRFLNGQVALTLSEAGIDKRLLAPETAQAISKTELAMLDSANDRIVILTRDGTFDRQYKHADFAGASAFAIRDGQAYVYSGSSLRRVTF
ncbi:MAG: hypothetical protein ABI577_01595 [bacterium]